MNFIPAALERAAGAARVRLDDAARTTASYAGRPSDDAGLAMVSVARDAIFSDALDAAVHARLEELKTVAK